MNAWRVSLDERALGSSSIIVPMSAIRKLAVEAMDNGLLAPELAAGIQRVKSAKTLGVRTGNWLNTKQAQALLNAPDTSKLVGLRDRAIIAVLLGCALRRFEAAALTMAHVQQRDGRWCIVDLVGKHGRIRTVPMPTFVKVAMMPGPVLPAWWTATFSAQSTAAAGYRGTCCPKKSSGKCCGRTPKQPASPALRLMIAEGRLRNYAAQPVANWSRSRCFWAMPVSKRPSGTSAPNRISCTLRTMESS